MRAATQVGGSSEVKAKGFTFQLQALIKVLYFLLREKAPGGDERLLHCLSEDRKMHTHAMHCYLTECISSEVIYRF